MLVARASGARPYAVLVDPLPDQAQLAAFARGALIRIVDPEAQPLPDAVARWRTLWGLTAAEARAASALVAHEFDLRAAAEASGITYATIRTQLAAIFAKTGTGGQPELMRLLTRVSG
jgi:DNA-binding CsgD family transcriptional regulator